MEKNAQKDDRAPVEQQQSDQSVEDTQMPLPRPTHMAFAETVTLKDVPDTLGQNINPLTIEDLKKILHQTTLQSQLCTNLVFVSVEELHKAIAEINREKVNT